MAFVLNSLYQKPKVAVCLSGSLRSIEKCHENFLMNVITNNKDMFDLKLFYFLPMDINSHKITKINNEGFIIQIEKDEPLKPLNCVFNGRQSRLDSESCGGLKGWLYQLQGIERSFEMVEKYEKQNNITFDYILRIRHDVLFIEKINFAELVPDRLNIPYFHKWFGLNDRFAFGPRDMMVIYMKMYSNLYEDCNNGTLKIKNAEWYCKYNLEKRKVNYTENKEILFNRVRKDGKVSSDCKKGYEMTSNTGELIEH